MGSKIMVFFAVLAIMAPAQGQEGRRRPGSSIPPGAAKPLPPAAAKPVPKNTVKIVPVDEPPAVGQRSRLTDEAAPIAVPDTAVIPAIEVPDTNPRRRPGLAATGESGRPTTEGGTTAGKRVPFDFNSRSGLLAVAKPPADAVFKKEVVPDRWQLTRALGLTSYPWYDPYNQNTIKADRPVWGSWFFNLNVISDSIIEPRRLPTPAGPQGEGSPGQLEVIADGEQVLYAQNVALGLVYYRGNTTFKPPDWEFRFTPAFNFNRAEAEQLRALQVDPSDGRTRNDSHIGVQDLFVDKHLRNASSYYDFDSLRIGIQPFNADFRGFLFRDEQLGVRLFGNRANNVFLYNIAWFRRLEKDTNSGLNDLGESIRADDVFVANAFLQDFPVLGFTSQAVALYNRNQEGDEAAYFNKNGFIERPFSLGLEKPRNYDVVYLGLNGDGHFGRWNLTSSGYFATGRQDQGVFVDRKTDIAAFLLAGELSYDFDWRRIRLTALYASGDKDPFDDVDTGFDAVLENPLFAGADTSFWVRQNVPLIGGGGVALSGRNGILNSLRSSKDQGQSNFANPGTVILGIGADFDLTPEFRISGNVNHIGFATARLVEVARQQSGIGRDVGTDISLATIWRPYFSQNIVLRASGAALVPGKASKSLYGDEVSYSVLVNLTLTY